MGRRQNRTKQQADQRAADTHANTIKLIMTEFMIITP